jgi:hypothetical protein
MKKLVTWSGALAAAGLPVCVLAQAPTPSPTPTPQPGQIVLQQGTVKVGPTGPVWAAFKAAPTAASRTHEGSLKGLQALQIGDGEARLILAGGERVVTPGTVIGTDTVKSITPGRMVLRRMAAESEGGEGIVIVSFDAQGKTQVQVFATKDPTAKVPREVK